MGNLCAGPKTNQASGNHFNSMFGKPSDEIIIYGDYSQAETRTMISALEYCNISHRLSEVQSNFDTDNSNILIDDTSNQQEHDLGRRQSFSSAPSEQPKTTIELGKTSSIVLTNYQNFL